MTGMAAEFTQANICALTRIQRAQVARITYTEGYLFHSWKEDFDPADCQIGRLE
jgi:hypothetical protein